MRRHRAQTLLRTFAAVALCLGGAVSHARAADTAAARTVELLADKDNRFKLPDGQKAVYLKAGERVNFKITSRFGGDKARDGAVHSFVVRKLREQGWDVRLKEGVQEFVLTAPSPGTYLIECTVFCGPGHDDMNIKMVVK